MSFMLRDGQEANSAASTLRELGQSHCALKQRVCLRLVAVSGAHLERQSQVVFRKLSLRPSSPSEPQLACVGRSIGMRTGDSGTRGLLGTPMSPVCKHTLLKNRWLMRYWSC